MIKLIKDSIQCLHNNRFTRGLLYGFVAAVAITIITGLIAGIIKFIEWLEPFVDQINSPFVKAAFFMSITMGVVGAITGWCIDK